jgi:DNA polymerase I-like protein with 3'-5' exonuclease and polymerase domains
MYVKYLTTASRAGILRNWIAGVDANGNLHGSCFTIGTPSGRARHSGIVNVPSADSVWGKEMRSLFISKSGWKMIGCDSSGNQARGLAHYLKSEEYVKLLLEGDIHQYNADILTEVLKGLGIDKKVPRGDAKRVLYATLFGAAGLKVCGYVLGYQDKELGDKIKKGFLKGTPGFADLMDSLNRIYGKTKQTGKGYIPGIGGNKIFCDSQHKLLVYLLQSCEKATTSAALMITMRNLREANIPFQPCIYMHDEIDYLVPEEFAEQAAEIGRASFNEGARLFGVTIMDGSKQVGNNWYECH